MQITRIEIKDFLGLERINLTQLGKVNKITGDNGTGKSSILKAITEAFKSSGVDPHIIRDNGDSAEIYIELDNNMTVRRRITPTGNTVKVVVDGQPMSKPQKFLNDLIGAMNFNPVDFFEANKKTRRTLLLSAIPFQMEAEELSSILSKAGFKLDLNKYDFDQHGLLVLDTIKRDIYDIRKERHLTLERQKKVVEQARLDLPELTEEIESYRDFDVAGYQRRVSDASAAKVTQEERIRRRDELRVRGKKTIADIDRLKGELAEIQETGTALNQEIDAFEVVDIDALHAELGRYQAAQKAIGKIDEIAAKQIEINELAEKHETLDRLYKKLTGDIPKQLLAEVELPIKGLEITGDDILVDGISIDKRSTGEKMTSAVDIAKGLTGDLKAICIDRYESLGKLAQRSLEKTAETDEFEYFITIVTDDPQLGVEVTSA